jgi:heme exporter protein D
MNSHTFWKAVEVTLLGMVALVVPVSLFVQRRNALREAQAKEMFRVNTIKD